MVTYRNQQGRKNKLAIILPVIFLVISLSRCSSSSADEPHSQDTSNLKDVKIPTKSEIDDPVAIYKIYWTNPSCAVQYYLTYQNGKYFWADTSVLYNPEKSSNFPTVPTSITKESFAKSWKLIEVDVKGNSLYQFLTNPSIKIWIANHKAYEQKNATGTFDVESGCLQNSVDRFATGFVESTNCSVVYKTSNPTLDSCYLIRDFRQLIR